MTTSLDDDEFLRFGTAFGFMAETAGNKNGKSNHRNSTATTTTTTDQTTTTKKKIQITDLSMDAIQHYMKFQQWKQQHAEYLDATPTAAGIPAAAATTTTTTTTTTTSSTTDNTDKDYDDMDAREWYNAYDYAIRFHLLSSSSSSSSSFKAGSVASPPTATASTTTQLLQHADFQRITFTPRQRHIPSSSVSSSSPPMMMMTMPTTAKSPSRILYGMPAGMNISSIPSYDDNTATAPSTDSNSKNSKSISRSSSSSITQTMMEVYATALSVYIYRTVFVIPLTTTNDTTNNNNNNNDDKSFVDPTPLTIIIDVRGGNATWPNLPAIQFVSFVRYISKILPYYFPMIVHQMVLYPFSATACTAYNYCIKPILDTNIQQMIQLVVEDADEPTTTTDTDSTTTNGSHTNTTTRGLYQFLAPNDVHYLNELRHLIVNTIPSSTGTTSTSATK